MTDVFRQQPLSDDEGIKMSGKIPEHFKKLLEEFVWESVKIYRILNFYLVRTQF